MEIGKDVQNTQRPDTEFVNGSFDQKTKKIGRNDKAKDNDRNKTYIKWIKKELEKRGINPKAPLESVPKGSEPVVKKKESDEGK